MSSTTSLYITTDSNNITRISSGKDLSLGVARWTSTSQVCIYKSSWDDRWYGSCRMKSAAKSKFYDMGLNQCFHGHRMSVNAAAALFANKIAAHEDLMATKASAPDEYDVQVGRDDYDQVIIKYRGFYAARPNLGFSPPAVLRRGRSGNFFAIWKDEEDIRLYSVGSRHGSSEIVAKIISKIDEVADGAR